MLYAYFCNDNVMHSICEKHWAKIHSCDTVYIRYDHIYSQFLDTLSDMF